MLTDLSTNTDTTLVMYYIELLRDVSNGGYCPVEEIGKEKRHSGLQQVVVNVYGFCWKPDGSSKHVKIHFPTKSIFPTHYDQQVHGKHL